LDCLCFLVGNDKASDFYSGRARKIMWRLVGDMQVAFGRKFWGRKIMNVYIQECQYPVDVRSF
jgi:hypothetical protein